MEKELVLSEVQELGFSIEDFNPDDFRPQVAVTEKPRLPRISIVQSTSTESIQAGARPGQFQLDWKDPTRPVEFVNNLRVFLIDVINGRVMFPFTQDGKPDRTTKEPWCASSDGEAPRSGEMFGYVGKTYTDWRNKKPVTIVDSCENCPLSRFKTYKDDTGKLINQPPPCQEAPQFVLWLVDQGYPAIFQSSAPTVRVRLIGQPKKGYPGINKFFQPIAGSADPQTGRSSYPYIKDGKWFSVGIKSKMETHKTGNVTYVPVIELDTTPLEVTQVKAIFDIKQMYNEIDEKGMTERDRLSGQAYLGDSLDYDEDAIDTAAGKDSLVPPSAKAAAAKLGKGSGRRRITDDYVSTNETADADESDPDAADPY